MYIHIFICTNELDDAKERKKETERRELSGYAYFSSMTRHTSLN